MSLSKILKGNSISMIPIESDHREKLRINAKDDKIWNLNTYIEKYTPELFNTWFTLTYNNSLSGSEVCFSVSKESQLIGSSRYYLINQVKQELSIGFTWIKPDYWGTSVNPEMKYLLIENAFEQGFKNIYFHVDNFNLHSQAAMKKLGAKLHLENKWTRMRLDGSMRNTLEYVITFEMWEELKNKLVVRLKSI